MDLKKEVARIEVYIGYDVWERIKNLCWKMQMRIDDLEKSRDMWKKKYKDLKAKHL